MKKLLNSFELFLISLLPSATFAAEFNYKINEKPAEGDLNTFLTTIVNWILGIAGALAVLFIVYAGFMLVTSAGNTKRLDTAKKTLTYAIGGLIAVILARVVLGFINGSLGSIFGGTGVSI
jgi:type IV secretory pathway VirB2 component (pilin)